MQRRLYIEVGTCKISRPYPARAYTTLVVLVTLRLAQPEPQLFFLSSYNSTLLSCPLLAPHYLIISHLDFSSSSHSDTSSFSQPINYFPYLDFQDQLCHRWAWQNWWDKEQVKNGETELVRQNYLERTGEKEGMWLYISENWRDKNSKTNWCDRTDERKLVRQSFWDKTKHAI